MALSTDFRTNVLLKDVNGSGCDFTYELKRSEFDGLMAKFRDRLMKPIERALEQAGIEDKNDVESVVMVGGSTWIPIVNQMV